MPPLFALRTETRRDIMILIGLAVFMAAIGAFDTDGASLGRRILYWSSLMLAGGIAHAALEAALARGAVPGGVMGKAALLSVLMTLPLTPVVWLLSALVFGAELSLVRLAELAPGVLVVSAAVVGLLGVTQTRGAKPIESAADIPEAIRENLPFEMQRAALHALEAEDHYVRIHTAKGSALVRMKLSDAMALLGADRGFQTHRSWWVNEQSIRDIRWRRGSGVIRLENDLEIPVSRTFARSLTRSKRL